MKGIKIDSYSFLAKNAAVFHYGEDWSRMIKILILYTLECWKDNLEHLIII